MKMSVTTLEAVNLGALTQLSELQTVRQFELKNTVLGQIPYDITYMGNLKYGTNKPIHKTDSQT